MVLNFLQKPMELYNIQSIKSEISDNSILIAQFLSIIYNQLTAKGGGRLTPYTAIIFVSNTQNNKNTQLAQQLERLIVIKLFQLGLETGMTQKQTDMTEKSHYLVCFNTVHHWSHLVLQPF